MNKCTIYEQPLNERVRTFLRLEHLFGIADYHSLQDSQWDNRIAISCLLDIADLVSRSDIRSDLIKELEHHAITLDVLKSKAGIDLQKLNDTLDNINLYLGVLRGDVFQPGHNLKRDKLTTSIKQRIPIPGGTCNFDLPAFHHWLHKPAQSRHEDLEIWKQDLSVIQDSLAILLLMLRSSTRPAIENAELGFYQRAIESKQSCQLIRVILAEDCSYFPEISAGKYRFTIRFMEQASTIARPVPTNNTVEFELHCCIL